MARLAMRDVAARRGLGCAIRRLSSGSSSSAAGESFGYQKVGVGEKEGKVRGVFASVASNYDVMNDLMSAGEVHTSWAPAKL